MFSRDFEHLRLGYFWKLFWGTCERQLSINSNHVKQNKKIFETRNFGFDYLLVSNETLSQLGGLLSCCHKRRQGNVTDNVLSFLSVALSRFKLIVCFRFRQKLDYSFVPKVITIVLCSQYFSGICMNEWIILTHFSSVLHNVLLIGVNNKEK